MLQCKLIIRIQFISQQEKMIFTLEIHPQSHVKQSLAALSGSGSLRVDPHTKGSFKSIGNSLGNFSSGVL